MQTWQQIYTPVGGSLAASVLAAALPMFVLGYLLGVRRSAAWVAATSALVTAMVVALVVYRMPAGLMIVSTLHGAAFGLFPIGWIVFSAILLFDVTVEAGCLVAIERSLRRFSDDRRMQVLLVAFAFGAFIEGTSGFGTPVAISAALLTALGIPAFRAAGLCLVANTAPVAFGALGTPVVTLAGVTGLPLSAVSAAVGRICPFIAAVIPFYLLVLLSGWSQAIAVWPAALVCGLSFAITQFAVSNYIGPYLTDILSALAAVVSLFIVSRVWKPATTHSVPATEEGGVAVAAAPAASHAAVSPASASTAPHHATLSTARAWAPYVLLVLVVLLWGTPWVSPYLESVTHRLPVPTLHNVVQRMPPVTSTPSPYPAVYVFNWLGSAGTACFVGAVLAAFVTGLGPMAFLRMAGRTGRRLLVPELTIATVLALAYVMNYSGATATLGLGFAATGVLFPFFGTFLGWLGVFLTGSDTSANALFGNLQMISAQRTGLNPVLMTAMNSSGGVLGKMISLQSIAVAAAATGMPREYEGRLFLFTLKHSVALTAVLGLLAMLLAYVFPWVIPTV
jgi:lactate permease